MNLTARLLAATAIVTVSLLALIGFPGEASAHPLGNFTINHSTTLELSASADSGALTVYRVLDLAEIPAFQALQDIPDGPNGEPDLDRWASTTADDLRDGMTISVEGERVQLRTSAVSARLLPGQGGLQTLRLEATYSGPFPRGVTSGALSYADANYADRIGWREVIVRGGPGIDLASSQFPTESITQLLLSYPAGGLSSPPDVRDATVEFLPGVGAAPLSLPDLDQVTATRGNRDSTLGGFTKLIAERELSAGFVVFALLVAMAFGAVHALSPGHGKTIVAAYLVGSRGTLRHAALLGLTVTLTHTSSVYALGFVTLYLSQYVVPEDLYPWMGMISGAIIVVMGITLLTTRVRALRLRWPFRPAAVLAGERGAVVFAPKPLDTAAPHEHPHDHGRHPHDSHTHDDVPHSHGWTSHTHILEDGEAVTWRRLIGLGVFGGMIPCPSAIVVMLSAIALHRVGFGLVLIVAFSFGLAAVLTGIGFLVVWAQRVPLLRRAMDRAESSNGALATIVVRGVPIAAAALVFVVGLVMIARASSGL